MWLDEEAQKGQKHTDGHTAYRHTCPMSAFVPLLFGISHFLYLR